MLAGRSYLQVLNAAFLKVYTRFNLYQQASFIVIKKVSLKHITLHNEIYYLNVIVTTTPSQEFVLATLFFIGNVGGTQPSLIKVSQPPLPSIH